MIGTEKHLLTKQRELCVQLRLPFTVQEQTFDFEIDFGGLYNIANFMRAELRTEGLKWIVKSKEAFVNYRS